MLALLLACADPPPPPAPAPAGPDLLLITVDTLRADRLGAYGDARAATPQIDRLAAQGLLFREAHSPTPLTLPAHASLMTGRPPPAHGVRDNAGYALPNTERTLAEALAERGYHTAAFVGAYVLHRSWGLDQGYATYDDPFHPQLLSQPGQAFGAVERPGAEVVNRAMAWWRQSAGPRFAWVHLYEPHAPWLPLEGGPADPYRAEVARVDALVGKLVAAAGPGAWVALTSDHGESLWEGGEREHGVLLGPSATRVPLILRPPGGLQGAEAPAARPPRAQVAHRPAGQDLALDLDPVPDAPRAARVEEGPVSLLDLAPTLAALAGASLPGAAGQDLGPALRGQPIEARPALSETWYPWFHFGWSPLFAVQTAGGRWESDLAGLGALPAEPAAALQPWSSEAPERPGPLSAEASAALEALGYLSSPAAGGSLAEAPDPRVRVGLLTELHAAESIEDPAARSRALQALVARAPELSDAHISWSLAEAARGDLPAAIRITEEVLERWPEHPTALVNLGLLARQAGEGERALDCARRLQALNPRDARGYRLEAAVMVDREDAAGVLRATEAGLKVAPEDPNLSYLAAIAELQAGDAARAGQLLEVARDAGTAADDVELWLGVAAEKQGRVDLALKYYDAASRRLVGDVRPWLRAGLLLQEAGRCEEAMPWLVNASKRGAGRDPGLAAAVAQCRAALRTPR